MNKENSSKSANSIRSPYKTRSYTAKTGNKPIDYKKAEKSLAAKPVKKVKPVSSKTDSISTTTKKNEKPKATKQQTGTKKSTTNFGSISTDTLQLIFEYVGAYDTLWNARRVCRKWNEVAKKESLSTVFVKANGWSDDFALCKKRKEHKTHFEHCFQRVTVRKFYEKVQVLLDQVLPWNQDKHKAIPTQQSIRKLWAQEMKDIKHIEDKKAKVTMTMPWQYMEFATVFNGIRFHAPKSDDSFHFLPKVGRYLYENCNQDSFVTDINKNGKDTSAWLVVSESYGSYEEQIMNCDKDHPDFGMISRWTTNCGDGKPLADNFLEIIRGMYFNFTLFMEKFKIDGERIKWLLKDELLDETDFGCLQQIYDWVENGKAVTTIKFTEEDMENYVTEREECGQDDENNEDEEDEDEENEDEENEDSQENEEEDD